MEMKSCDLISVTEALTAAGDTLILPGPINYYYIEKESQISEAVTLILQAVSKDGIMAVDVETTGFDPYTNEIVLLQIGLKNNIQFLFDMRRLTSTHLLHPILALDNVWKVGHNIKFDAKFIKQKLGVTLHKFFDTLIAEMIIRGGEYTSGSGYSLDAVILRRLGRELKLSSTFAMDTEGKKTETIKSGLQKSFTRMGKKEDDFSPAQLAYAAQDVCTPVIFDLASWQKDQLKSTGINSLYDPRVEMSSDSDTIAQYLEIFPKYNSLWQTALLEFKFIEVLVDMEHFGIRFCKDTHQTVLEHIRNEYKLYREDLLKLLSAKAVQKTLFGTANINPDSSDQVLHALNTQFKLKLEDTNAKTLEEAAGNVDPKTPAGLVLKCLLDYRATSTLVKTFGEKLAKHVHPVTGRIHASCKQILDTGRMSMSKPNCQNIPAKIEWKKTGDPAIDKTLKNRPGLRECFKPADGYKFVIFDYSAQELRVAASVTLEPLMLQAFAEDKDLHCFSATLMYNENYDEFVEKVEREDVDAKTKRTEAKTVSFGSLYGSGPGNLSRVLNIAFEKAKEIIDRFWGAYPALKESMVRFGNTAIKCGYSSTILGRRRYYTDNLNSIKYIQVDNNPDSIQKKIDDFKMIWFKEKYGDVTFKNIRDAKNALINKLKGEINRQSGNHVIQGTSADMLKLAAVNIRNEIITNNLDMRIVGLIHDELIVEARADLAEVAFKLAEKHLINAMVFFCPNVPAKVEGKIADEWKK